MKWTTDKVRTMFLEFFANKEHHIMPSASLVPNDDPSLLWINSGVATLKPYFEGKLTPPSKRMANSQKAIRTNDIDIVGLTARHHTFFEMLGNFSIGDYAKKEAIKWAWELLTSSKWFNLDATKIYITIFSEDEEAYSIWTNEIKISEDHIIKGDTKTNFWDMGLGPCGPNTEIYFDRGAKYDPENIGIELLIKDIENDRYIEIWNIVFSQFNNDGFNNYTDLPRKNIDTGAGLERIVSVLQNVPTNFDTDLFQKIISKIETFTNYKYEINNYFTNEAKQKTINTAFKIISDHIRCLTFAISDGVYPSNKNRGYILRRLIRRAEVYGQQLEIDKPFLYLLVPAVVKAMSRHYPELLVQEKLVIKIIKTEEIKFRQTLKEGQLLLFKLIDEKQYLSGLDAFHLFDTYGYPIELTKEIADQHNIKINENEFWNLVEQHKITAQLARKNIDVLKKQDELLTNLNLKSEFIGYDHEKFEHSKVVLLVKNNEFVSTLSNTSGVLVLDKTPFYAEKGGQAADSGIITSKGAVATVVDVQPGPNNINLHHVDVKGTITNNELVIAEINQEKRFYTKKNHTGTHLIHAAIRRILGNHVMQSGSFNNQDYLRLDFNHFESPTELDILEIEKQATSWIKAAKACQIHYVTYAEAIKMNALAFFGEKYDQMVRVVQFGDFSIELCGGTHCNNTKEVEDLLITSLESKGSGSYRIHALSSFNTINKFLETKMQQLKTKSQLIFNKITNFINNDDLKKLKQKIDQMLNLRINKDNWRIAKKLIIIIEELYKKCQKLNIQKLQQLEEAKYYNLEPSKIEGGIFLLVHKFYNLNMPLIKSISDYYKNKFQKILIVFINEVQEQTIVVVTTSKTLINKQSYQANKILQKIMYEFSGKGGGTEAFGQGKINSKVSEKIIFNFVRNLIK